MTSNLEGNDMTHCDKSLLISDKVKIGIVVVTYSIVPDVLFNSIKSRHDCEWFVFHHGSETLTEGIKNLFSTVKSNLHILCENRGLAKSWNEGISASFSSGNDLTLIINDDIEFLADGFDCWVDFILRNDNSGLVLLTGEEPQEDGTVIVRQQNFACFSFGVKARDLVGAFDENFIPAYFEDTDYIVRSSMAGINYSIDNRILCRHKRSSTIRNDDFIRASIPDIYKRNREYFISKWGGDSPENITYSYPFNDNTQDFYIPFRR